MSSHPPTQPATDVDALRAVVLKHWGFSEFRPLQLEAMAAARQGRDALVVMPTGGGKSLCYQAPALLAESPTVVVSPLIALMKDQVDGLIGRGIQAAFFNSSLDAADKRRVVQGITERTYKLIFVSPERFASEHFWDLLGEGGIGAFAIDEAHCISHWGHDFRGDYRRLDQLKQRFPEASVHAFTATATPRVRQDIVEQLKIKEAEILVGDFFRPNLHYHVRRRQHGFDDVVHEVERRKGQPGIVYCIRRVDVEGVTSRLEACGVRAVGYHAGMSDDVRTRAQDAFAAGEIDVVVATVAFGMGIDRSDIRFVIHAAMPKSVEHYQQETGRAGRDGELADCVLFYSGADFGKWKSIVERNEGSGSEMAVTLLSQMYNFCSGVSCRHKTLVTYFGQAWERDLCEACDVCLGGFETLPDSTVLAQKIMSAVARTGQRFGATYVCEVLIGHESERVLANGHDQQSTFALMCDYDKKALSAWCDQLVDQGLLERGGKYRVLTITPQGWRVLKSEADARLVAITTSGSPTPRCQRSPKKVPRLGKGMGKGEGKGKSSSRSFPKRTEAALGKKLKCPSCSYSLIGNTTGSCPECGQPLAFENLGLTEARFLKKASDLAGEGATSPKIRLADGPLDVDQQALFESLRTLRREIADELNSPAFVVFSDKTLRAIVRTKPTDEMSMRSIKGVGPAKCEAFGQRFIECIQEFTSDQSE